MTDLAPPLRMVALAIDTSGDQPLADHFIAVVAETVATQSDLPVWASQRDAECQTTTMLLFPLDGRSEGAIIECLEEVPGPNLDQAPWQFSRLVQFDGQKEPRWRRRALGVRRSVIELGLDSVSADEWWAMEQASSQLAAAALRAEVGGGISRKVSATAHAVALASSLGGTAEANCEAIAATIGRTLGSVYTSAEEWLRKNSAEIDWTALAVRSDIDTALAACRSENPWAALAAGVHKSGPEEVLNMAAICWARHANRCSFNLLETVYLALLAGEAWKRLL